MEKQLAWAHKSGGVESLGISKVGCTMLARLIESQIWHQLASSVPGGFRKGAMASPCLDARHFSSSLCATGAFQSGTLVLKLTGSESEYVVYKELLGAPEISSLTQSLPVFAVRRFEDLSSWHWNPGLRGLVWEILDPEISPLDFFIHHTWMRDQPIVHLCPSYQSGWICFL